MLLAPASLCAAAAAAASDPAGSSPSSCTAAPAPVTPTSTGAGGTEHGRPALLSRGAAKRSRSSGASGEEAPPARKPRKTYASKEEAKAVSLA